MSLYTEGVVNHQPVFLAPTSYRASGKLNYYYERESSDTGFLYAPQMRKTILPKTRRLSKVNLSNEIHLSNEGADVKITLCYFLCLSFSLYLSFYLITPVFLAQLRIEKIIITEKRIPNSSTSQKINS